MKKLLPLIILFLGVFVLFGVYFFVIRGKKSETPIAENEKLIQVPLEKRPVVSLTPTSDGHYLNLKIEKIIIDKVSSMDYELVYKVPDGPDQGVPGTVDIEGKKEFEAEILLGSESSGKFRYDEGVEDGSLTIRFRNDQGKLITKFSTDFKLQTNTDMLASTDGNFTLELNKKSKEYYIVVGTIGVPEDAPNDIVIGPYGVFSSGTIGKVNLMGVSKGSSLGFFNGKWTNELPQDFDWGIFVGTEIPHS